MPKSKSRKKKSPKRVLALPDLEQAKTAVLNSLTSASGQRTYEHAIREFVAWSIARSRVSHSTAPSFSAIASTSSNAITRPRPSICAAAVRRIASEAAAAGLLSPELAAGIRRVKGVRRLGVRLGNWLTPEQGRRLLERSMPSTPRALRDHAMVAMLIGCGLRRAEVLALTLESVQQREEHWVIADLVGKGGHVRTVPIPGWVKDAVDAWTDAVHMTHGPVFRAINRPGASGATACRRRCSGMWSGQRQGALASRSSHRTTSVARVRDSVTWRAANWIRFDSCWATSRSRRQSATLAANSDYDARSTIVSESSRTLRELRAGRAHSVRL